MSDSLTIDLAATTAAGQALASTADDAASVGSAFLAAAGAVPGTVPAGASIGSAVQATGEAFGAACAELGSGLDSEPHSAGGAAASAEVLGRAEHATKRV